MTTAEKKRAWRLGKKVGRERCLSQTMALELLAERYEVTLHEVAEHLKVSQANAYVTLDRLADQKLAVCIRQGTRGRISMPSVWQLRETFERNTKSNHQG